MKYKIEINKHKTIIYYYKNKYHREDDLPSTIHLDGTKTYYKNGKCHRSGDKPSIITSYGYIAYYKNGNFISDNSSKKI